MTNNPNNPAAFPLTQQRDTNYKGGPDSTLPADPGMSLLDYFAGQVLVSGSQQMNLSFGEWDEAEAQRLVTRAYDIAELMLTERTKRLKNE